MLQVDVKERATLQQISEHPWLKNEIKNDIQRGQGTQVAPLNASVKEIECKVVSTEENGTSTSPSFPLIEDS